MEYIKWNKCIQPNEVNYTKGKDGKYKLEWNHLPEPGRETFNIKCGKCWYCLMLHTLGWAYRLTEEAKQWKKKCFMTLTYNNENLPTNNSLIKKHHQNFIKKIRKVIAPEKLRYFLTGEYGIKGGRAHLHIITFNYLPNDLEYLKTTKNGDMLYTSKIIEKIWGKGFISIGINMSFDNMKYMSKYMSKINDYDIFTQTKPYIAMSKKPGIGYNAVCEYETIPNSRNAIKITNFKKEIYNTDKIYFEGKILNVPPYFDKLAEKSGINIKKIKDKRKIQNQLKTKNYKVTEEEKKLYQWQMKNNKYKLKHLFELSDKQIKIWKEQGSQNFKTLQHRLNSWYKYKEKEFTHKKLKINL